MPWRWKTIRLFSEDDVVGQGVDDGGVLAVGTNDADRTLRGDSEDEVFAGRQGVDFDGEGEGDVELHEALAGSRPGN